MTRRLKWKVPLAYLALLALLTVISHAARSNPEPAQAAPIVHASQSAPAPVAAIPSPTVTRTARMTRILAARAAAEKNATAKKAAAKQAAARARAATIAKRKAARIAAAKRAAAEAAQRQAAASAAANPPPTSCTQTSSGFCIQGGEFCPQASYGDKGTDSGGDVYTCTGDSQHPHWE